METTQQNNTVEEVENNTVEEVENNTVKEVENNTVEEVENNTVKEEVENNTVGEEVESYQNDQESEYRCNPFKLYCGTTITISSTVGLAYLLSKTSFVQENAQIISAVGLSVAATHATYSITKRISTKYTMFGNVLAYGIMLSGLFIKNPKMIYNIIPAYSLIGTSMAASKLSNYLMTNYNAELVTLSVGSFCTLMTGALCDYIDHPYKKYFYCAAHIGLSLTALTNIGFVSEEYKKDKMNQYYFSMLPLYFASVLTYLS